MGKSSKKRSLFPFQHSDILDYVQRDLVALIQSPDYRFELPDISPQLWRQMNWDHSTADRLEFLGDSLMHSHFSDGLSEHFPCETPGFYTRVRSVLEANSTFAHLMIKVGSSTIDSPVKAAGDIFESIMAAFHHEQGPEIFGEYFKKYFTALIIRAGHADKVYELMHWKFPGKERPRAPKLHVEHSIRHGKNIQMRLTTQVLQRKYAKKASLKAREARRSSKVEPLKITEVIDLTKDDNPDARAILEGPSSTVMQLSSTQRQISFSNPAKGEPAHHAYTFDIGTFLPIQSEMKCSQLTNTYENGQGPPSNEIQPRPSRPRPFLNSSAINYGPGYNHPQGSSQGSFLTHQSQSSSNTGSSENPIVID